MTVVRIVFQKLNREIMREIPCSLLWGIYLYAHGRKRKFSCWRNMRSAQRVGETLLFDYRWVLTRELEDEEKAAV